jgi:iron complex transport system permease protein
MTAPPPPATRNRRLFLIAALVLAVVAVSIFLGRYPKPYLTAVSDLSSDELARNLVLNLRLPRILAAVLLGMTLSAAGAVFQMIFRNPLVDSGFLGVSQGAAFGASLAIVYFGAAAWAVQGSAAFFAFLGLAASYYLARRFPLSGWVLRLILAGIAVSALYSAGTGALKYMADPHRQLPDITFWLLGGLWNITWTDVLQLLPVVLPCLALISLLRWRLNLLSLREETAFSLGVAPARERLLLLVAATAATAAMVSKSGSIAWVGLIVPHMARRLVGSDARRSLPAAMLLGSVFLLLCDDLARILLAGEIPLGILTSFFGTALFLVLLLRRGVKVKA